MTTPSFIRICPNQNSDDGEEDRRMSHFVPSSKGHRPSLDPLVETEDLFCHFRPFLIIGKLIGVLPIQGLFQKNVDNLKIPKFSVAKMVSVVIWMVLTTNVIVGFISMGQTKTNNAVDCAWAPAMLIFFATALYTHVYLYKQSPRVIHVLSRWRQMSLEFTLKDHHICRDVTLITLCIMASALSDNVLLHLKLFPAVTPTKNKGEYWESKLETMNSTPLEIYYYRSHPQWAALISYNPAIAIYVFIGNKLTVCANNYMDIFIIVFSRALYFKFKALFLQGQLILCNQVGPLKFDKTKWRQLVLDHETLREMLWEIQKLLSPLIFITYGLSIYWICLQLLIGLSSSMDTSTSEKEISVIGSMYAAWAFLHLVARIVLVTIMGAGIHEWAHKIIFLLRQCPLEAYTKEVQRAEQLMTYNFIGLNGLKCFAVTRPLILGTLGAIFTFEIILMQASLTTLQQEQVFVNLTKF